MSAMNKSGWHHYPGYPIGIGDICTITSVTGEDQFLVVKEMGVVVGIDRQNGEHVVRFQHWQEDRWELYSKVERVSQWDYAAYCVATQQVT